MKLVLLLTMPDQTHYRAGFVDVEPGKGLLLTGMGPDVRIQIMHPDDFALRFPFIKIPEDGMLDF